MALRNARGSDPAQGGGRANVSNVLESSIRQGLPRMFWTCAAITPRATKSKNIKHSCKRVTNSSSTINCDQRKAPVVPKAGGNAHADPAMLTLANKGHEVVVYAHMRSKTYSPNVSNSSDEAFGARSAILTMIIGKASATVGYA